MNDADPTLMKACDADLTRYQCKSKNTFEEVVECLREHFDDLGVECRRYVFQRQEVEAADNDFDSELHVSTSLFVLIFFFRETANMISANTVMPNTQKRFWTV